MLAGVEAGSGWDTGSGANTRGVTLKFDWLALSVRRCGVCQMCRFVGVRLAQGWI